MPDYYIDEIRISPGAEDKLAAHGVTADEVLQVSWNGPAFFRDRVDGRNLMIGKADGGRLLTIVIERSGEQWTWDVVTGWDSGRGERSRWEKLK